MKALGWFIFIAAIGALAYAIAQWRKRWEERQRIAEARFADFIAQARPAAVAPAAAAAAPEERLLLDAAGKAHEAGEPALAMQLYARLIARFPQGSCAGEARAAVGELKKKLAGT